MPRKTKSKKKFPGAQIGNKSTAKVTGGRSSRRKPNTVSASKSPSKLVKAADKTRKSSAIASVGTFQPAKMSPVKKTVAKVNQRKASSFDKALKLKKKKVKRGR